MPWIAPTVGYSDNRGYLRCASCADEDHQQFPVSGDQWFGADDKCDSCGKQFEHVPTSKYIHVSY